MQNDIMMALTELNGRVSFGGGGGGRGGGGGGGGSRDTNSNRNQPAGPKNTTTVNKTPGHTVNREGMGDLGGGSKNQSNKDWSGCVNVNLGIVGGEVCYGK